ncbi:MAG: hypothetical protein IT457_09255 [Planctomycetes bacterium]|nr:hypothetical protein [Planctomycetota bacterium]
MNDGESPRWARVQALLDQGRDPFADPGVLDDCAADPGFAAELLRLTERVAALRGVEPAQSPRRRRHLVALAAAAMLLALGGAVLVGLRARTTRPEEPPPAQPLARSPLTTRPVAASVLAWTCVVRERVGARRHEARLVVRRDASPRVEQTLEIASDEPAPRGSGVLAYRVRVSQP